MATPGGLFGAKPATGSLFGTPTATTTPAASSGGLFGGAGTTGTGTATSGGGGLFGAGATGTTGTTAAPGGLFGNKPAVATTGTTTGATGGLFGNTTSTQQQPAQQQTSGGLFGSTPTSATQLAQQQQTSGGLFGSTPASATQPAQQSGGGLFGAATTTPPAATGGGLFGQAATQTQQKPAGGIFGQPTAQPATQVAAVQINYDSLRPRSRFDDLAQPIQNEIGLIDKGIQRVIKMRDEIGQFMPQHEKDIEQLGKDVQFVETKFRTVQHSLDRDIQTVKALQDMTKKNIADGQLSFKAADNLKLPTHYHQTGLFAGAAPSDPNASDASSAHASAQDLITYFNRICDDVEKYKKRLDEYRSQIERDMPGVENGLYEQIRSLRDRSTSVPVQDHISQVLLALRETGSAIVAQAGVIAETRERLSRLQAGYLDNTLYGVGMNS